MRFNSFSYIPTDPKTALEELKQLGFALSTRLSDKDNLEIFVRRTFFLTADTDHALSNLIADWDCDALSFFQSDRPMTAEVFYHIALQLLDFVPHFDYTDVLEFIEKTAFPIQYDDMTVNLHQLLCLRTKNGNTLLDQLVADGLLPADDNFHFFNGKALATFSMERIIREVVYVETTVDTAQTGQADLVKVSIQRPRYSGHIPAVITNSPYHQGINGHASDAALHKMEAELQVKETGYIQVEEIAHPSVQPQANHTPTSPATERLGHLSAYSLNEYFLARGFASLHVSGVGTLGSTGYMTSGDYQQVEAFKAVIDWLNGRAKAYTDHRRMLQVKADWANGKVATTGLSYLGTMSNALATTGVAGLEVIIAEAGISSWYDYYRENGLVTSPGGYPGEDLDSLTALTYSKSLQAGDFLRNKASYEAGIAHDREQLDRASGDYNAYWHARNYLLHANQVNCEVVFTHGSQDWNVKPIHVWNMFHALPATVKKHLFFHNGAHVYMNNWQSIDFRESMNALLSQKLLGQVNGYQLPQMIWQDNQNPQTWRQLDEWGSQPYQTFTLGQGEQTVANHYDEQTFAAYGKDYKVFHQALFTGKAQQVTVDIPLEQDIRVNGRALLHLRVKSSTNKGLLSAQILDFGENKRLQPIPALLSRTTVDNGRYHVMENLTELPFVTSPYRVISKGYLNLQNRTDLLTIEPVRADEWMEITWELQPTVYQLKKGDTLRLVLYTTDFEVTIRDNNDWTITLDLGQSRLDVPYDKSNKE